MKETLLTFQDERDVRCLLAGETYKVGGDLEKHQRRYREDIEQLGGEIPVWAFRSRFGRWTKSDLYGGTEIHNMKCESGYDFDRLQEKLLVEFEKDIGEAKVGKTHNAFHRAVVVDCIKPEEVLAVYRIVFEGQGVSHFHPRVEVIRIVREGGMLTKNFQSIGTNNYVISAMRRRARKYQSLVDEGEIEFGSDGFSFRNAEACQEYIDRAIDKGIKFTVPKELSKVGMRFSSEVVRYQIQDIENWYEDRELVKLWVDVAMEFGVLIDDQLVDSKEDLLERKKMMRNNRIDI